jgi:hypothetical protein
MNEMIVEQKQFIYIFVTFYSIYVFDKLIFARLTMLEIYMK